MNVVILSKPLIENKSEPRICVQLGLCGAENYVSIAFGEYFQRDLRATAPTC